MAEKLRPKKKLKTKHLSTITLGYLHSRKGSSKTKHQKRLKILFDTGCSATLISHKLISKLKTKETKASVWKTKAGSFKTTKTCKIKFTLPAFHEHRDITWRAYVDESTSSLSRYDMIIGRDLLQELGINFLFSQELMEWDFATTPMLDPQMFDDKFITDLENEICYFHDPDTTKADRIQRILDVKYTQADLRQIADSCKELSRIEQDKLHSLLKKFEHLFDGTVGTWKTDPVELYLKDPNSKPYHAKPYPVPHSQEQKLKDEVERFCKQGILRKVNRSEWACPMFTINKPDGTLRSLADLRELNKRIKRHPFPIPKIQDMLQKLEGFQFATSLDLNMGYYHIELTPNSSRLCTIVLPWGKYEYLRLPMGLCNSPDIFQEKMSELMAGLEFARAYLDDLLTITKGDFEDHLDHLEQVLTRLSEAGLKINASKSSFCQSELEYLGYWITRKGIRPMTKKVEAILKLKTPTKRRELQKFIGMINYYRDMWPQRSEILAPLTALTSKKVRWKWTKECQAAFDNMKTVMARDTLLAYPDFSQEFEIHTDASDYQLGACISQNGKPIAFYTRKLKDAQLRYTVTEKELLSIVETLKEFRNILLGQKILVHTDHQNLTYKTFNSDRVMRWRLYIEEYSPELRYVKGEKNVVTDALSRLAMDNMTFNEAYITEEMCSDWYCYAKEQVKNYDSHPVSYKHLDKAQQADDEILKILQKENSLYHTQLFHGGGTSRQLICFKGKIVVPKLLQKHVIDWYHTTLCHPGIN
jgi:hypothetical protein